MFNKDSIIEPLRKEIDRLRQDIKQLRELVEHLNTENKGLKEKLAAAKKNSHNSSKPPSSDVVKPPKPKTSKNEGKRKAGGQPGHPKHTRPLYTENQIDMSHPHVYPACPDCGSQVELRPDLEPRRVQQIEIKEIPVLREEHCSYAVWCEACQKIHYKPFPESVVKAGLFQERITADQRQLFFPSATIGFTGYDSHWVSPWEGPPRGSKNYRTFLWLFWAASIR